MKTLKGTYDGKHIRLDEDIELPKDSKLIVIVLEDEDEKWNETASHSINRAFGESEPEYELSMVKEPNPEYESG